MFDILDTSENEEYSAMRDSYVTCADCFFVCFSLIDASSLDLAHEFFRRIAWRDATRPVVLVGTKCDLLSERQVSQNDVQTILNKYNWVSAVETSAKENINVKEPFWQMAQAMQKRLEQIEAQEKQKTKSCVML